MKKILSIILAVAMMMTMISTVAFAAVTFTETADPMNDAWASQRNDSLSKTWPVAKDGDTYTMTATSETTSNPAFRVDPLNCTYKFGTNYGTDNVFIYTSFSITANYGGIILNLHPAFDSSSKYGPTMAANDVINFEFYKDVKNKTVWVNANGTRVATYVADRQDKEADFFYILISNPAVVTGVSAENPKTVLTLSNMVSKAYTPSDASATMNQFYDHINVPATPDPEPDPEPEPEPDPTPTNVTFETYSSSYPGKATWDNEEEAWKISSTNSNQYYGVRVTPTGLYTDSGWKQGVKKYVLLTVDFEEVAEGTTVELYGKGMGGASSKYGHLKGIDTLGPNGVNLTKYNIKCVVDTENNNTYYYVDNVLVGFVKGSPTYRRTLGYAIVGEYSGTAGDTVLKMSNIEIKEFDKDETDQMGVYGAAIKNGKLFHNVVLQKKDITETPTNNTVGLEIVDLKDDFRYTAGYKGDELVGVFENNAEIDPAEYDEIKVFYWSSSALQPYHFVTAPLIIN